MTHIFVKITAGLKTSKKPVMYHMSPTISTMQYTTQFIHNTLASLGIACVRQLDLGVAVNWQPKFLAGSTFLPSHRTQGILNTDEL
jgi:hypothetical protein